MAISLIRSAFLYLLVVALYRLMGKRQIGELQPSELVLAIMISDIASVPMQSISTPLVSGVVPIIVVMSIEVILSFISQKNQKLRRVITGTPSLIISEGKMVVSEMERLRFNIDDLFEQLRNNGQFDISQIAFAVLETNGNISIMPKELYRPATAEDVGLAPQKATFPSNIIKDGEVDKAALKRIGKDENWLSAQLRKEKIGKTKDVFLMCADQNGVTFVQRKGE